ncbi:MAG: RnfABCDGE type electron transport complex subunit G [Tannerellaceae bacterium]|nr:RnfABCDGE type electron transport complex subunit G [Tannerellaceae bacterium]
MKKLSSSLPNMLLSLTLIAAAAGALLAAANHLTSAPIAKANTAALAAALNTVCPPHNNDPLHDAFRISSSEGDSLTVFPAFQDSTLTGAAVQSSSPNGFAGNITLLVGFDNDGTIINYAVLQHNETPGLGSKMDAWFRNPNTNQNILGRKAGNLTLSKDGGDVDAITASTITSRAFLHAINRAYTSFLNSSNL